MERQKRGRTYTDVKLGLLALAEKRRLSERHEANLVKRIGSVGDKLPEEDLLLAVERVDNDIHKTADFGLELHLVRASLEGLALFVTEAIRSERLFADALKCQLRALKNLCS